MSLVFRDDDINVYTDFTLFKQVHELFKEYKVNHRLGVLAKDLWENKELFWYLCSEPYLDVQLHGWEHKDYVYEIENKPSIMASMEFDQVAKWPKKGEKRDATKWYEYYNKFKKEKVIDVKVELESALNYLKENSERMTLGKKVLKPKYFLPPWNKTNKALEEVCREVGLKVDTRKTSEEGVYLFHYWSVLDGGVREETLMKYLKENK